MLKVGFYTSARYGALRKPVCTDPVFSGQM